LSLGVFRDRVNRKKQLHFSRYWMTLREVHLRGAAREHACKVPRSRLHDGRDLFYRVVFFVTFLGRWPTGMWSTFGTFGTCGTIRFEPEALWLVAPSAGGTATLKSSFRTSCVPGGTLGSLRFESETLWLASCQSRCACGTGGGNLGGGSNALDLAWVALILSSTFKLPALKSFESFRTSWPLIGALSTLKFEPDAPWLAPCAC